MISTPQQNEISTIVAISPYQPQAVADARFAVDLSGARLPRAVVSSWQSRSPTEVFIEKSEIERLLGIARYQESAGTILQGALLALRNITIAQETFQKTGFLFLLSSAATVVTLSARFSGNLGLVTWGFVATSACIASSIFSLFNGKRQRSAPLAPLDAFSSEALMRGYYWLHVESKPEYAAVEFATASREQRDLAHTTRSLFGLLRCASGTNDRRTFFTVLDKLCRVLEEFPVSWRASNPLTDLVVGYAITQLVERMKSSSRENPSPDGRDHPYINAPAIALLQDLALCSQRERSLIARYLLPEIITIEEHVMRSFPQVCEPFQRLKEICLKNLFPAEVRVRK